MRTFFFLIVMIISTSCIKVTSGKVSSGGVAVTGKQYFACANNASESFGELYTFLSNGRYVLEQIYYDANNCTTASKRERNYMYGEYSYNSTTLDFTDRAYKLEFAYLTNAEVAIQNGSSQCGFTDWTINVVKDVTDNYLCMGGTIDSNGSAIIYQAILNDSIFDNGSTIYTRVNL